jgi:propanol-preferring alcohol dehydrogenase
VLGVDAQLDQVLRDEKRVVSTVIGTRVQMRAVLALAAAGKLHVTCETYPLEEASVALARLKANDLVARAVLVT